jgi:hypothetical protein
MKRIKRCFKILFSYLACYQIWLNLPVDHHQFGYSTIIDPKKRLQLYSGYTCAGRISRREYRGGRQNARTHTQTVSVFFSWQNLANWRICFFQEVKKHLKNG